MNEIKSITKSIYFVPLWKRLFMRKKEVLINTEYDIVQYSRTFLADAKDNILIECYYCFNEYDHLIGRKVRITASLETIYAHLGRSKKVMEAIHWLHDG